MGIPILVVERVVIFLDKASLHNQAFNYLTRTNLNGDLAWLIKWKRERLADGHYLIYDGPVPDGPMKGVDGKGDDRITMLPKLNLTDENS